ncbi:MAG: sortase [Actinobacteria bacterium]|uniref:Unannotated protein n=1 Tax=freshwater metagenome TaxID=449393 RepID=A0A6J7MEK0_9ZZZZ|nr:sortase [Actinomycetota bacterium]MSX80046.1 sortase [Actinomycetota bacterium]
MKSSLILTDDEESVVVDQIEAETSGWSGVPSIRLSSERVALVRGAVLMLFVLMVSAVLHLFVASRIQHSASQQRLHDRFRSALATGTAPVGSLDGDGRLVSTGTPVAYLQIPALDVEEVIVEGTSSSNLYAGPGHRRDTPLPGQVGRSVIVGRRLLFGGPFALLDRLKPGNEILVTTAQGVFRFSVIGIRRAGDPIPEAPRGRASRLVLATAGGSGLNPSGVLWVDADLQGEAVGGPARVLTSATLPGEEQAGSSDSRTLWALVLWLQLLLISVVGALWSWRRWGHALTWIIGTPVLLLVSNLMWDEFFRLLPNVV